MNFRILATGGEENNDAFIVTFNKRMMCRMFTAGVRFVHWEGTIQFGRRQRGALHYAAMTFLNADMKASISACFPIVNRMWFGYAGNKRPTATFLSFIALMIGTTGLSQSNMMKLACDGIGL